MKRILSVFGTRPEAIKMAPIILKLQNEPLFESRVCITAQHREMLDAVLKNFDIRPDFDLSIMRPQQTLSYITQAVINGLDSVTDSFHPDIILVHGDTTTAFAAALVGFYKGITVCHVEAGLRSGNILSPFPEEFNRRAISSMASVHFAPTENSVRNLLSENIDKCRIFRVGNTVIDALLIDLQKQCTAHIPHLPYVLMTMHRREHTDENIYSVFEGIRQILTEYPDIKFIYPVHRSPRYTNAAGKFFQGIKNITLSPPLDVCSFHHLLSNCRFVITDSGGIQEEASFLGKPVLVIRENTERPEASEYGTLRLVGTKSEAVYNECKRLLTENRAYADACIPCDIYGDGKAADRIVDILKNM